MQDARDISLKFDTLCGLCQDAAEEIHRQQNLLVVSHVDADGLTAAAIICTALERLSIDYKPLFFRQLDLGALDEVADQGADLVIFTDLGSGMIQEISDRHLQAVVVDHHKPAACTARPLAHINPHLVGADGATQLSGSGTSFLLARALTTDQGSNDDLAALAVVGAVGDLQDMASGHLLGLNRRILDIGSKAGAVSFSRDIKLFGRQTRPVYKMLEYSQDPYLPGLSGKEDACIAFLKEIGIRLGGEKWRRWIDLSQEEKSCMVTAILRKGLRSGVSNIKLERLIGEVYVLTREREGTELRDASEYSTLLNATARYGHADVGLQVCMGDRDKAFDEAHTLLSQHRSVIRRSRRCCVTWIVMCRCVRSILRPRATRFPRRWTTPEARLRWATGDDYEILAPLGRGMFGSVWRARDLSLSREVAIKVLHPHIAKDDVAVARFRREARLAAQLAHPAIVPIYDSDSRGDVAWYTMELAEGGSVASLISRSGPRPIEQIAQPVDEVLEALIAAHSSGIIHRDLKPENILIDRYRRWRIGDFGIAYAIGDGARRDVGNAVVRRARTVAGRITGSGDGLLCVGQHRVLRADRQSAVWRRRR